MAQKQGGSKKPRKRPGASVARAAAEKRKAKRVADQKARQAENKERRIRGELKPWDIAKAERKASRENVPMQSRTGLGNIVKKLPDGTTRIYPGSDKETKEALEYRARVREEELREAARKKTEVAKKKANAEKANRVAKKKAS